MTTPKPIAAILASPLTSLASRILATCLFWTEFLNHVHDLPGLQAYVEAFGIRPFWLVMGLSLFVQAVGSALVIADRMVWLGAGMLALFTLLTIPIAHDFWNMTGPMAVIERLFSEEHLSVIGGLMAVCVASEARAQAKMQRDKDARAARGTAGSVSAAASQSSQ
jgi:transmembrane protein